MGDPPLAAARGGLMSMRSLSSHLDLNYWKLTSRGASLGRQPQGLLPIWRCVQRWVIAKKANWVESITIIQSIIKFDGDSIDFKTHHDKPTYWAWVNHWTAFLILFQKSLSTFSLKCTTIRPSQTISCGPSGTSRSVAPRTHGLPWWGLGCGEGSNTTWQILLVFTGAGW